MKKKAALFGLFSALLYFPFFSFSEFTTATLPAGNLKWIMFAFIAFFLSIHFLLAYHSYLGYYKQPQKAIS